MRHLETLGPVCPVCRSGFEAGHPLRLAHIAREEPGHILEGALHCSNPKCQREYPIIDGIPLLVANLRHYVSENILAIYARRDLSGFVESILGDCCGPNSPLDQARQHLSSYVWDHYGEFDGDGAHTEPGPGSMLRSLREAVRLAGPVPAGPALDLGCGAGRGSFELAAGQRRLVLGVDLHFPMLRLAAEVLRYGKVKYPRRRSGVVYEWREFGVAFPDSEQVDFWACDASALPFPAGTFSLGLGLSVLDCVGNPRELLVSLSHVLRKAGKALLSCPYDWSPGATPIEAWLGGHSQRSVAAGSPEAVFRSLLSPGGHPAAVDGLKLVAEREHFPWQVRLHDRGAMSYDVHLAVAEKE